MVQREQAEFLRFISSKYPVVTVTGPRQSGKTVMVKSTFTEKKYFNMENPADLGFASDDPKGLILQGGENGCIIDEIQKAPELLSYIQVDVDSADQTGKFILTGSNQFGIKDNVTQSLAGRTALLKLLPFSINEVSRIERISTLEYIAKGFYPRIYDKNIPPVNFYGDYFETYIERDLSQAVNIKNLNAFRTFVKLCAGRVGRLLNLNSMANDIGVTQATLSGWLSILENSYIVYRLEPFLPNLRKRLIKSPKLYFYDVGLAAWLSGIENVSHLENHPLRGNFFENLVISEVIKFRYNHGLPNNLCFYRDSNGNQVDLIYRSGQKIIPVEIKAGSTIMGGYLKGIKSLRKIYPQEMCKGFVAYNGIEEQDRSTAKFINYRDLTSELDKSGSEKNDRKIISY